MLRELGKERRCHFVTIKTLWYSWTLRLCAVLVCLSQERCRCTRKSANDPRHTEAALEEKVRKSGLFSLEHRRLREGMTNKIIEVMVS